MNGRCRLNEWLQSNVKVAMLQTTHRSRHRSHRPSETDIPGKAQIGAILLLLLAAITLG